MKIFFLVVFILRIQCLLHAQTIKVEEVLPEDYDYLIPPNLSKDRPVNVSVSLWVIQIRSVNEIEMDFKMDLVVRQLWEDHRLIFPQKIMGVHDKVVFDAAWGHHIWTPGIWFKNALNTKMQEWVMPSIFYWFMSNKTVCFSGRVTLELTCDMNMEKYPHDSQFCGVSIIALMNPSSDLHLKWVETEPIRLSRLMNLPQFEVSNPSLSRCDTPMYGEIFSCIDASFTLTRRSGYFIINIYIPTVLIVLMSMLTFWIPPEAVPARITLGVTSLLTIITKQYQSNMPSVSYVVALNIWLSACIAFVFCSLLEYAIVLALVKKRQNEINPLSSEVIDDALEINNSRKSLGILNAWNQRKWRLYEKLSPHFIDFISRFVFPFTFVLFTIIYGCTYST